MTDRVSSEIIGKWLKAWSLSRALPLPVAFRSGYKVDVGYEKQKARYVFPALNDDFVLLSNTIDELWVFLKICAAPEEIKGKIPEKWILQPQGYMMSCFRPMTIPGISLPDGYQMEYDSYPATFVVRIVTLNGELAATGRVILVDDLAVYDRISTEPDQRRKGLATLLVKELERTALAKGVFNNFLVATEEGRSLYQSLGWELYSLYTSVVIAE